MNVHEETLCHYFFVKKENRTLIMKFQEYFEMLTLRSYKLLSQLHVIDE